MNAAQYATADSIVAQLRPRRDRLAALDRLNLDNIEALLRNDVPEIVRLSQEVDRRTGDPNFAYLRGFYALAQLRPKLTLAIGQRFDSARLSDFAGFVLRDQATAYHLLGEYASELATLDRGIMLRPSSATAFSGQKLRAFAAQHDSTRARALADSLLQRAAGGSATALSYVRAAAAEFDAHGDTATAVRLLQRALSWAREYATATPSIEWERTVGNTFLAAGQLDSAAAHYLRAQPDPSIPNALARVGHLAIIAALRGDTLRARAVSDSLGANTPRWDQGRTVFWQAAVAAYLGKRDEAVRLLKSQNPYQLSMVSWHSNFELRPLRGYPPFDALITPER